MKLRKIRLNRLALSGIIYRIHIILIQSVFFWLLTGEWKWAIGVTLAWNCANTFLYYNYHYWFARVCKLGRNDE